MAISNGKKRSRACLVIVTALTANSQEMPGKGLGCWDKQQLCNLNCLAPQTLVYADPSVRGTFPFNQPDVVTDTYGCINQCDQDTRSCKEPVSHEMYIDCATACAKRYETSLFGCLSKLSSVKVGTYNQNTDACSNIASGAMDTCMSACYFDEEGTKMDRFGKWSPAREEGVEQVRGIARGQWQHPFLDPEVIYGNPLLLRGIESEVHTNLATTTENIVVKDRPLALLVGSTGTVLAILLSAVFAVQRYRTKSDAAASS